MANSPQVHLQTMLANIPEKTGKTLDEWKSIIGKSGYEKHGEMVKFLKSDHNVTHGFANLIVTKARETGGDVDLVEEQYAGNKSVLRPLYDLIVEFVQTLGDDVEIAPKKSSVSLRRKKQFALVTPATKTRIDLSLSLKGEDVEGRLESYNAMCSHRVRLETVADFDDDVKTWLSDAYSRAG